MPARVWILASLIVGLLIMAFVAIAVLVPRDGSDTTANPTPGTAVADATPAASSTAAPAAEPEPVIDPALLADIDALVAQRAANLPLAITEATWLPVSLVAVVADGDAIQFDYKVDIDRDRFDGPSPAREVVPGFFASQNNAFTGFQFTSAYNDVVCADAPLADLISRGVVVTFSYYDRNDSRLAFLPVRRCPAPPSP